MGSRKTVAMPRMEKPLYKLSDNRIDCGMRTCENNVNKKWWFKHYSRQIKCLARKDKKKEKIGNGILKCYGLLSVSWWNTMLLVIHHVFHQYFFTKWRFLFTMSRKILSSHCSTHHGNKRGYHTSYSRCTGACSQANPAHARGIHLRGVYIAAHISYAYKETSSI